MKLEQIESTEQTTKPGSLFILIYLHSYLKSLKCSLSNWIIYSDGCVMSIEYISFLALYQINDHMDIY